MSAQNLQIAALLGAFWTAVLLYRGDQPVRFVAALGLGAVFAHLGWALLHLPAVIENPWALLDTARGLSVLFVPLGLLLLVPDAGAFATLPLALAVARLGCLAAGCCHGADGEPIPLAEIGGLVGLHVLARRVPSRWVVPAVLAGVGAIRLVTEPWRATPPLGAPVVPPGVLAAAWVVAGLAWNARGAALRPRIGSAAEAPDWLTPRFEPLLRALALMLAIWLLFPLAGFLLADPARALLAASAVALAFLLALGGPLRARLSGKAALALAGSLPMGWLVARVLVGDAGPRPVGAAAAIAVVVLAPAFEELLYRERLLQALQRLWGAPAALLGSSALFALAHAELRMWPIAFAGGLAVGAVVLRTGSLAAAVGLHAGWNLGTLGASPLREVLAAAGSLP